MVIQMLAKGFQPISVLGTRNREIKGSRSVSGPKTMYLDTLYYEPKFSFRYHMLGVMYADLKRAVAQFG